MKTSRSRVTVFGENSEDFGDGRARQGEDSEEKLGRRVSPAVRLRRHSSGEVCGRGPGGLAQARARLRRWCCSVPGKRS
jgi:hypothetical protein